MRKLFAISCFAITCLFCSSCEYCEKQYTLTGVVRGSGNNPIEGVKIYGGENYDVFVAETDQDGQYIKQTSVTRAGWSGTVLKFETAGYQDYFAPEYTEQEAGWDKCGDITVIRDAVLDVE